LVLEDVQANATVAVDVWVEHLGSERYLQIAMPKELTHAAQRASKAMDIQYGKWTFHTGTFKLAGHNDQRLQGFYFFLLVVVTRLLQSHSVVINNELENVCVHC